MPQFPTISADAELREVVSRELAEEAMAAIAARHGLAGALQRCARGSDLVYAVGDVAIIKLSDPRWTQEIENEVRFLEALEGRLDIETPRVIAAGALEGWPYVAMSAVSGAHLDEVWDSLDGAGRSRIATDIGALIAALQPVPVNDAPPPSWRAFVDAQRAGAVAAHRRRGATDAWLDAMAAFLDDIGDPYDGEGDTATLHTELLDTHVMVSQRDGAWRVSGLIDFADAMRGAPSYEITALAEFIYRGEPGLLATTLESAGWPRALDEGESRRLLACGLLHRFASLPRMLEAAGIDSDAPANMIALARKLHGRD